MNDAAIDELTRNMMALDAGLHRITETFGEHVQLRDEDPVVFGAGHYVLYPVEGSTVRLSITEQYAGTDWSDDERVPTSWAWEAEARVAQPSHGHPWVTLAEGEVASADYARLLNIAKGWAGPSMRLPSERCRSHPTLSNSPRSRRSSRAAPS